MNHSYNEYFVYDGNISNVKDLDEWASRVYSGQEPALGPGHGEFDFYWKFFYDTRAFGSIQHIICYLPFIGVALFIGLTTAAIVVTHKRKKEEEARKAKKE